MATDTSSAPARRRRRSSEGSRAGDTRPKPWRSGCLCGCLGFVGAEVEQARYTREQRQRYREKVRRDLDVFERMLGHSQFEFERPMTGLEIELNLVKVTSVRSWTTRRSSSRSPTPTTRPSWRASTSSSTSVRDRCPVTRRSSSSRTWRASLNHASERAAELNTGIVAIGILPTVMPEHFEGDWISENIRYEALNIAVLDARGEDVWLELEGPTGERIARYSTSLRSRRARRCSCTCRWSPSALRTTGTPPAGPRRSPARRGRELALLPRPAALGGDPHPVVHPVDGHPLRRAEEPGVRPRVWFGERWITSIFDLFEENVRYFPALLPEISEEEPEDVFERGEVPELKELRLHNGTVYRWNRPIYDIVQADRTCGWRTACCPRARASSTSWPTPPSTTGRCGSSTRRTARCGRG